MNTKLISSNAPEAIGPYSQGIFTPTQSGLVFVSGQLPIDPKTNEFAGEDIASQTKMSILNIQNILKEAGMSLKDVVNVTVYLSDIKDFTAMNEVYGKYFLDPYPSRCAYQVAALPKGAKVEIAAVAARQSYES